MNLQGQWVWVTGASSGLGKEIATQLARQHRANLVISARRADRLEALKAELEASAGVQVRTLVLDVANMADVERAIAEAQGLDLSAVILNAGVGHLGFHHELSWADFHAMIQTNVVGTARITSDLAHWAQQQRRPLRLMLVTSLQGFIPIPFQSAYAGTKGFLTNFGLALSQELRGTGVKVQVFAPTGVKTEMTAGARFAKLSAFLLPVEVVAKQAIRALVKGSPLATSMGFWERVGMALERLLPRMIAIRIMGQVYRQSVESSGSAGGSGAVVGSVLKELFLPSRNDVPPQLPTPTTPASQKAP
ncbi:MAG: SDR family NAD(P)-dependent oxidoreductase [Myxococcaceae bacterium]|nr:SDR family NAD(P)-dependent oxidoreductase [Myxococcaceae bacterium]